MLYPHAAVAWGLEGEIRFDGETRNEQGLSRAGLSSDSIQFTADRYANAHRAALCPESGYVM